MKLSAHLQISRHGIYYFRCIIPKVLRPIYSGKSEIKYSLKTRDPVTAKRQAYILSAQTSHIFSKAKKTMARYDPKAFNPNDQSTWPTANDASSKYELSVLPDGSVSIKTDPNNPEDHRMAMEAVESIGRFSKLRSHQHAEPEPEQFKTIKLSEAILRYMAIRNVEASVAKSISDMTGIFNRFLDWTSAPHDPSVDKITRKTMGDYMLHLLTKATNHKTKELGLSKSTTAKHISFLHGLFSYLKDEEFLPADIALPTDNLTPFVKGEKKKLVKKNAYQPFTSKEITKIFDAAHFNASTKPHEFWVPLLGLYSGARINELSQPYLEDFTCENGLWRLHIHGERGNRIKTDSSERYVPLHPDIIALGLLDYLDDVRAIAPEGRIFPYLLDSKYNGFGDVPSESFARHLTKLNIISEKKVFHSFRSTINHHLIPKKVSESDRESLLGHASDGINPEHYGRKLSAEELWDLVVSKISFPEISDRIEALRYTKGSFTPILKAEVARRNRQLKHMVSKKMRQALAAQENNQGK